MAHLLLTCLGPFQVTLDGRPLTEFKSNKVRALLAYLAVEAGRPHHREALAGLLWPDWPDREALSNLRYALSNLRQVIGDRDADTPFLLISRDTLQFNQGSDYWLDVDAFTWLAELSEDHPDTQARWQQAEALYRGGFLEGGLVSDSLAFEAWSEQVGERLARQLSVVLQRLAGSYERQGQYQQAHSWARRLVELEPWNEAAHRLLLRNLAISGQRGAALAHYETCRRLLAETLEVEPAEETARLYQQIRDGQLAAPAAIPDWPPPSCAGLPAFLEDRKEDAVEQPAFVGRGVELGRLDRFLAQSLSGQGRIVFVAGDAGSGKTALLQEFSRRAHQAHADLGTAGGNCNAYTGVGDPYLPFREILELLTGDVEARWFAGDISRERARRLWEWLPAAAQALVESGPDLLDTFIPSTALLKRVRAAAAPEAAWLSRLTHLAAQQTATAPGVHSPQQSDLFEQYARVLQALAQRGPLLLFLDDLQWADLGSISLLFHLVRRLRGSRILIVGAYRPEDVAIGRDGQRHPLESVVNEIQRDLGDIILNLNQAHSREFVDALLDHEPNQLDGSFRQMLYHQTRGHPLFTIELLRGLQERGDLFRDSADRWLAGPSLDWEMLPARVEAVFAERICRLRPALQAILRVACVEGELFTAEVAARVLDVPEPEMLGCLSGELDRTHRLVRSQSIVRLGGQLVSRYRFRHFLFQRYLYHSLDEVERVYLHEQVGRTMEAVYQPLEQMATPAVSLARHFQEAGITAKAATYLCQAGEKAVHLSAYQEAIAHLNSGLELLMTMPDSRQRQELELDLQLNLSVAWMGDIPGPDWRQAVSRARQLCQQLGKTRQLCLVMGEMSVLHYVRAEYRQARQIAEEALDLAQKLEDPLLQLVGHWHLGFILFGMGEYAAAHVHLQQVIDNYDPAEDHQAIISLRGVDAGLSAYAYDACCLWCLGYGDQAVSRGQGAIMMARALGHAYTLVDVCCFGGCVLQSMRGEAAALEEAASELTRLSAAKKFPGWSGSGTCYRGEALIFGGEPETGMALIRQGLAVRQSSGAVCHLSAISGRLALALAQTGRLKEGLHTIRQAVAQVEASGELHWAAELYRLHGELLVMGADEAGAEAVFQQAVDAAGQQEAKMWQLRAATSLARLRQRQGRTGQARQQLQPIYDWFSEGFTEPDLVAAKALLRELADGDQDPGRG